jgi:DNA-binding NtrC family response regulator
MPKVLVVEKTTEIQSLLRARFSGGSVVVDDADLVSEALERLKTEAYDVLIWDSDASKSERATGADLLEIVTTHFPEIQIIVISGGEGDPACCRIRNESYHYIRHPIDSDKFCALVGLAVKKHSTTDKIRSYPEVYIPTEFEGMLAVSLPMREVFQRIIEAASAEVPVLVSGETGTGKELVAAAIHRRSRRRDQPYIPVHTGAMSRELIANELFGHEKGAYTGASEGKRGFFEQADHGTIFLDEISTMDERAQISLLRVLETKSFRRVGGDKDISVDVRVIAATNENLEATIKEGRFRRDLYYRLDVFHINLPALRNRPWAITFLTDHFVSLFDAAYKKNIRTVSRETYRCLRRYSWPGNVRELKNVIHRAVLTARGNEITPDLVPERIREACEGDGCMGRLPIRLGMTLDAVEKEFISMTLASTGGNKKQAASILGISRRALYNKLERFGLL